MKKSIRTIILMSMFTLLAVVFSALSCTVTSGGISITVYNNQGAGIAVKVYADDVEIADMSNGSFALRTVNFNTILKIYSSTYSQWLAITENGSSWLPSYPVTQPVSFYVKYNSLDFFHVQFVN